MAGTDRLWIVAVHLFLMSASLLITGVVTEESDVCHRRQVLCTAYGSGCSDSITDFVAVARPGALIHNLTFNSSAIQLNRSSDYEVFLQSSCSVGEVSLASGDECRLLAIDEHLNSVRFTCGSLGIRGITANAGVVLFSPSDPVQPGCDGNGTTVFVVVQRGADMETDLPDCSVLDNVDECLAVCSSYVPSNENPDPCIDDLCGDFIGGFCGTNCTSNDVETLLRCESLCCDNLLDVVNSTCPQDPCTDSFSHDCDGGTDISESDRVILNQCLSPCLGQRQNTVVNITCPGAVCNHLLSNCTRSPLYRLQCERDENLPLCRMLCTQNGGVNSLVNRQCRNVYSEFEVFCSEDFSVNVTCEDLPLFDISCEDQRRTCRLVCVGAMRDLDRRCGAQSRDFCRTFFEDLLDEAAAFFDTTNVTSAIDVLLKFTITSGLRKTLNSMQSLFSYFDLFVDETRDFVASEEDAAIELILSFEYLFDDDRNDDWNDLEGNTDISQSLQNMEKLAGIIGQSRAASNASFIFGGQNILMHAAKPSLANTEGGTYVFPSRNVFNTSTLSRAWAEIPVELLCEDGIDGCPTVVSSMVINNLATNLDNTAPEDNRTVDSFLLSIQVFGDSSNLSHAILEHPIKLYFTPLMNNGSTNQSSAPLCVFWDFNTSQWSSDGISTEIVNSSVLCQPTHLTSFAVLVRVTSDGPPRGTPEAVALQVVSYVGCAISIVSLIVTIILLLTFRKTLNKGVLLYIHLNLAIALLVALVIFVAGIETAAPVPWLCTTVAALLHYFFLCVFCWMLAEGIMLYLLVVRVFGRAAEKWYYLLILGWGLPVPVVAISVGILHVHNQYRADHYCWIKADPTSAAIWTFVAPMIVIVLVNSVILVMTVVSMVRGRLRAGAEQNIKTRELVKSTLKAAIVLLPLLGLTWVLGLFAVNENTQVFAWLFTIFNSLQGLFILVFHVLRNDVVLGKFRRRVRRRMTYLAKPRKGFAISTNNTDTMDTKETRLDASSGLFQLADLGSEELDHKNVDNGITAHESPDSKR